jgi:hypothetical protein
VGFAQGIHRLELRDMTGRLVRSLYVAQGATKVQLSTSDLPAGAYTMSLVGGADFPAQLIVKY